MRTWPASDAYVAGRLLPGTVVEISHAWPSDPRWFAVAGVGWILNAPGSLALEGPTEAVAESHVRVSGPSHPAGVLTGVAPLDSVIREVVSADTEAIEARLLYQRVPCLVDPQGPGLPDCPAGVPDRTIIEAFARGVYDAGGSLIPRIDGARTFDYVAILSPESPSRLYAVLRQRDVTILETPYPTSYVAFFDQLGGGAFALRVDELGNVVSAIVGGTPAVELFHFLFLRPASEIVFAPLAPDALE